MIHNKKIYILLIICLIPLIFSGCWNKRNLSEMGIVVGMGLEKVENDEIEITLQLVEPALGETAKGSKGKRTWHSLSSRGNTAFEANRNLLTKINKKLNYSNVQLVVIGERLANSGIDDVLDFFQRVHEIDKREIILVSQGIYPRELFDIEAEEADTPTFEMVETIKNTYRLASIRKISMYDLILSITGESNSVVGMVKLSEKNKKIEMENLDFTGAAVFKKDKLIGWLSPSYAYGFSIVDNKFINPSMNVPNPLKPDDIVTVEFTKSVAKKSVLFSKDTPVLCIEVHMEGKMVEQHGKGDLTSAEQITALEAEVSKQVKKIVNSTIKNAQDNLKVDIFGFGNIAHSKNLTYWKEVKNNWDDIFSRLPVEIKVQYKNKNMGFIKKNK